MGGISFIDLNREYTPPSSTLEISNPHAGNRSRSKPNGFHPRMASTEIDLDPLVMWSGGMNVSPNAIRIMTSESIYVELTQCRYGVCAAFRTEGHLTAQDKEAQHGEFRVPKLAAESSPRVKGIGSVARAANTRLHETVACGRKTEAATT